MKFAGCQAVRSFDELPRHLIHEDLGVEVVRWLEKDALEGCFVLGGQEAGVEDASVYEALEDGLQVDETAVVKPVGVGPGDDVVSAGR